MVENEDISGHTCLDCLNDMARRAVKITDEEQLAIDKCCAKCQGVPLDAIKDLGCYPCDQTERTLILMRQE
jgi:hypothetical protein